MVEALKEKWRDLRSRLLVRELLPDLEALVGPRCLRLLESGKMLDLAAFTNMAFHDETYIEELFPWFLRVRSSVLGSINFP